MANHQKRTKKKKKKEKNNCIVQHFHSMLFTIANDKQGPFSLSQNTCQERRNLKVNKNILSNIPLHKQKQAFAKIFFPSTIQSTK